MGLLLSILVGCVGVIELLAALKHAAGDVRPALSAAPCLSYHDSTIDIPSFHDSICGISHSGDLKVPRGARNKLENLHEYSLRVRSELRCHGYGDGTLSEISSRDALGISRPDSRLSMDFDGDAAWVQDRAYSPNRTVDEMSEPPTEHNQTSTSELHQDHPEVLPPDSSTDPAREERSMLEAAPIISKYSSSSTGSSVEVTSISRRPRRKKVSKKPESRSDFTMDEILLKGDFLNTEAALEQQEAPPPKRPKARGSSILRKPTRLKSKNAEISKSAENLSTRKTKRQRDPERRKSEISVQTLENHRDEWTNTSPTESEADVFGSRSSCSVQVQTNFEDDEFGFAGFSESVRDIELKHKESRKSFRSKRFPKSRSLDDHGSQFRTGDLERNVWDELDVRMQAKRPERLGGGDGEDICDHGEESIDEEFLDAEDSGLLQKTPIEYCIPSNQESDKAFWLIFSGEYTKAMNKDWHSGHFCCWQCDESLTGQRYVLRDEHPYCIKCYESIFANGCEECSKIIGIDSKDLSYKDKHWHEACFLCHKCRVSLVDKQFGSKVDKIYCGNCYDAQFASRCDGCGEIFRAGRCLVDVHW